MTTRKNIALTRQTFVGEVMSLLFSMLSRLVITFLPRGKKKVGFMIQNQVKVGLSLSLVIYKSYVFCPYINNDDFIF